MNSRDLFELAQQGDPDAIARLLNRILQPRGVTARVELKGTCLNILLISNRPLNQQTFVNFIRKHVGGFNSHRIQTVKVYGQPLGETAPIWHQEFAPSLQDTLPNAPTVTSTAETVESPTDFLSTLRTFQFAAVFPFRDVLQVDLYNHHSVRLLLFFGLFPLIVDLLTDDASPAETAWLFGIYYASIWGVVLYNLIKPIHFSWRNTLLCVLFTTFVGIPLLLFFQRVPPFSNLYAAIGAGTLFRVVGFVLGVGVLEELCKALPVYLLLRSQKLHDPHTGAFYGAMSGLGFAIAEGATYSLLYGFGLTRGELGPGSFIIVNTIRFVSLPLFHAILSGIVGYFIGLAAINPSRQSAIIFIGVAIAALLHGFYNSFAGNAVGLLIISFSILLFVTYLQRSQHLVNEMQRAERQFQASQSKKSEF